MAGNITSAEQAGEGPADSGGSGERIELVQERTVLERPERHLNVVYDADTQRDPPTRYGGGVAAPLSRTSQGMLDRSIQGQIGRMLRDVFSDVAEEPVPERFVKLLEALEHKEKQS